MQIGSAVALDDKPYVPKRLDLPQAEIDRLNR